MKKEKQKELNLEETITEKAIAKEEVVEKEEVIEKAIESKEKVVCIKDVIKVEGKKEIKSKISKITEPKKKYKVKLAAPAYFVVGLEDGTNKTIQESNSYHTGDIVEL